MKRKRTTPPATDSSEQALQMDVLTSGARALVVCLFGLFALMVITNDSSNSIMDQPAEKPSLAAPMAIMPPENIKE